VGIGNETLQQQMLNEVDVSYPGEITPVRISYGYAIQHVSSPGFDSTGLRLALGCR
jgi:hypothetical protein